MWALTNAPAFDQGAKSVNKPRQLHRPKLCLKDVKEIVSGVVDGHAGLDVVDRVQLMLRSR